MPASRKLTPSYLQHRQSGRGRAVWTDATGRRRERLLPGLFNSQESRTAFAKLQLEIETSPHSLAEREGMALSEMLHAYREFALRHYRAPDGNSTGEFERIEVMIRHARTLYGELQACAFGPLALKSLRQRFVNEGWCRKTVNQQVERLRRAFKWAASEELIPFETYQRLTTVPGLQRGRTTAPEPEPVGPVDDSTVEATLPFLNRYVRGLIQFQRLTGCRPGEACRVRRYDIDTSGGVWLYCPPQHKGSWRGKTRTIAIGPKLQELLREFFTPNLNDYLFSPRRAVEEVRAERAANRMTPRYPSHLRRNAAKRVANPKRTPDEQYNSRSYSVAVARAILKANREGLNEAKRMGCEADFKPIPSWHPNQLRHSHGTRVRKEFSLEHAGAALGHSKMSATEIYAERDAGLAEEVALRIG